MRDEIVHIFYVPSSVCFVLIEGKLTVSAVICSYSKACNPVELYK